jgi:hypothetical protein
MANQASIAQAPTTFDEHELVLSQNNSLRMQIIPSQPKTAVLGAIMTQKWDIKELVKGHILIQCLIQKESQFNPYARGLAGEIGILQFMPTTFRNFCVYKYGYKNDIWNPEIQIRCAEDMISDGLIYHWTTAPLCLY